MVYADTDFFLALIKEDDWLKVRAVKVLDEYRNKIEASEAIFIELMLIAKRNGLDPVRVTKDAMAICNVSDTIYLTAAFLIKDGVSVFDAFHAVHAGKEIISSDSVYDRLGLRRIILGKQA